MTPDHWRELEALFHTVASLDPVARSAHLRAARRDDPALTAEVERLLAAAERADGFLVDLIRESASEARRTARPGRDAGPG